ncbi:MAG: efflux RND transporter periplasmic adaptor subunit [Candidatus Dadabacteria bacterium]
MQTFYIEKNVTGKITFNEDFMTPVFSPYTGRVIHLAAKLGDEVERGSLLLEIDTPDLVQAESDLITARSSVAKAEATLYLARRNENRLHRLYLNKAAALKDWEQAQSDSKQAESDLRSAKAVLLAARSRLHLFGKSDEEIKKIEKEGKLDRITKVLSPISGTITSRKVGPGQYVRVDNADPIFTIADLSTMWVIADVYESDIPFIELGQPVEVHVAAYPNQVFKARISYIGASADPNTHRVPMRCVVKNDGQKLKAEMFAQLHVLTKSGVKSPAVPIDAIIYDGGRTSVWVERKPNQFIRRDVIIGQVQNGNVQIISGLQPGSKVVSKGSLFLSNALNP